MLDDSETEPERIRIHSGIMLLVCIALVTAALVFWIQRNQQDQSITVVGSPQPAAKDSEPTSLPEHVPEDASIPSDSNSDVELVLTQTDNRKPELPDLDTVKEGELDSTSWQNPFYKLFWKNQGWRFTETGMESATDQISVATFIRPYQKISVSFRVAVEKEFPDFELHLLTRKSEQPDQILVSSVIHFRKDGVSVTETIGDTSQPLKQVKLDLSSTTKETVPVRLVGTGNRFVISVGRRRVLTCAQPALQSGKECYLCFRTNRSLLKLTSLRIEGE